MKANWREVFNVRILRSTVMKYASKHLTRDRLEIIGGVAYDAAIAAAALMLPYVMLALA